MAKIPLSSILGALLLGLSIFICSCSSKQYRQISGSTWGTTYHIVYRAAESLDKEIIASLDAIDQSLSPFNKTSLISRINRNEDSIADNKFKDVFDISQRVCAASNGAFDPTLAPLINLWGFGYKDPDAPQPDSAQIAETLEHVGIMQCSIDPAGTVRKKSPLTEFNFSAVAKGYGVDLVAKTLREHGCADYMVEIGGEIALSGKNPHGENWRIQIDAPDTDLGGVAQHNRLTVLKLTDCCMATSGNYRNFRLTEHGMIGHTINPATGRPVETTTLSATVIAPSCAEADALATACMVMPQTHAIAMLDSLGVSALLVVASDNAKGYDVATTRSYKDNDF